MEVSTRSVITACLAAAMAVAGYVDPLALAVVSVGLALVVAVGWPELLELPDHGGPRLVVALAGVGAVAVVYASDAGPGLWYLPIVLAMAVVLAFIAELLRGGGRPRLVESLIGTVAGAVVAVSCAGWIAADRTHAGEALVVTSAVALAVASAVAALPLRGWLAGFVTTAAAIVAGGGVAFAMPALDTMSGVWVGVVAGLLVAALQALFDRLPELRGKLGSWSAACLPIAVGGTLIFIVGRLITG